MLVTPAWLEEHLADTGLVVVDMRWDEGGTGRARYDEGHVEGARFLDWATDLVDPDHAVAFMLAPPMRFAAALERCGISDSTEIVAYADAGHSGPFRLWWGCRAYGHLDQVRILDGGLDAWVAGSRPLTADVPDVDPGRWTPSFAPTVVAGMAEVVAAETDDRIVVLDSREPAKFRGDVVWFETGEVASGPDGIARTPRGELRSGRIPWARSVPWAALYRDDGTMKSPDELRDVFAEVGATPERRAITYCGVGISASALLYALDRAGITEAALYDGSWEEWARSEDLPVARG